MHPSRNARALFRTVFGHEAAVVSRAPGRVEVIGNHTDYNGGLVLGAAIDRHLWVTLSPRTDRRIRLFSERHHLVEATLDALAPRSGPDAWANYPLGVAAVLGGRDLPAGFDLCVTATLPSGAGLSSSAAFELATALALNRAFSLGFDRRTLVLRCREAEHTFAGVPCGILDQGVVAYGRPSHLVLVDARRQAFIPVPFPEGAALWIFNTHRHHELTGSRYADRARECREALALLREADPDLTFLTDLTPEALDARAHRLPAPLLRRARHVVGEHHRVRRCIDAFRTGNLKTAGTLLTASHDSSRRLFENSTPELDHLVSLLTGVPSVHGARLTGGGFGGAVMALTDASFGEEDASRIRHAYQARFGHLPAVLRTSPAGGARVRTLP